MASRTTAIVRSSIHPVRTFTLLTFPLGLVPAPGRITQVHLPTRVEAPPKSTCLKPKGTRRVGSMESSHNPPNLLHSRTITSSTTPPPTGTRSTTRGLPNETPTGVRLCARLSLLSWVALANTVDYRQQSVSSWTGVPDNMFEGSGQVFTKFGFEYWAEPSAPEKGFITWMVNGNPSHRVGADAMGPDQGPDGSGVGRRIIPEEPMVGSDSSPPTHIRSSCLAVVGPQLGNVPGLANHRPLHYVVSHGNADRLRSNIPEEGAREHWVQPRRLPDRKVHQQPSGSLHE